MKAFVTDGNERSALAITRSLGRRGIAVLVGDTQPGSLAAASKYCTRAVSYPPPDRQSDAFRRFLFDLVERERIDVVVPVTDRTTQAVSRDQDALRSCTGVAVPPYDAFEMATDKWALLQRAAALDVPIPHTRLVDGISGLKAVIDEIRYPAAIKPVRSVGEKDGGARRANAYYAKSAADVRRLYREHEHLAARPSLIQERIVGSGEGVFVLFDRGRLRAAFAHRRLREKPPSGGVSVLSESIAVDPQLLDYASRLLAPLGWHGVAMVEFKRDCRTGRGVLMEVNGRFWGSLQLAINSGVDFPYLAWQLALGRNLDARPTCSRGSSVPRQTYEVGVKSRWFLGDLDHLLLRLFSSDRALQLPTHASRWAALVEFLTSSGPRVQCDVICADDLRPALREARHYVSALGAAAMTRVRSRFRGRTLYAEPNPSAVHPHVAGQGR